MEPIQRDHFSSYENRMELVKRQNLSELVAGRIKNMILEHSLKPGDRLPTEQELADRFGVSRVSVREATKALSFLGIIRSAPRRGLTVGEIDMHRLTEYLGFHLAVGNYPKIQLLQTRVVIETGALPHVIEQMQADPEIYERLSQLTSELASTEVLEQQIDLDIAFHRELLESSGVQPLVAFNDLLQIFFNRFRESLRSGEWEKGARQHQVLLDALRAGDLARATTTLRDHIEYHKRAL